jgi:hypothetical protein
VFFNAYDGEVVTQFGRDALDSALLNADQVAKSGSALRKVSTNAVPAVSLRFVDYLFEGSPAQLALNRTMSALLTEMIAGVLDATGKDFELVWALQIYSVLLLQHLARRYPAYWPELDAGVAKLGGPARPTAREIDVFATADDYFARIEALFRKPKRAVPAGSALARRKLNIAEPPTLALWFDLWAPTVEARQTMRHGTWPAFHSVVEWRDGTLVCLEKHNHAVVDMALLVGQKDGTGENAPHVYLFQMRAWCARTIGNTEISEVEKALDKKLTDLFSESRAKSHVLRLAGIHSREQVTLVICALKFAEGAAAQHKKFDVVLWDGTDFCDMGGKVFANQRFVREIKAMMAKQ